jgi:4-hydroxyphenylpyruvate dioxygenase
MTDTSSAWPNPMGTDGFEFIEYAAPDPAAMGALFEQMGFKAVARHRHKRVTLYRQGGVNFILNAEPDSFAQRFARLHGPSICAIALRVRFQPKDPSQLEAATEAMGKFCRGNLKAMKRALGLA